MGDYRVLMKSGNRAVPITISSLEDLQLYDFKGVGHRGPTLATKVVLLESDKRNRFHTMLEIPMVV